MTCSDVHADIMKFWEDHKSIYPRLYKLFQKIVCILATSAASERAFSKAGYIFSSLRSQLGYRNLNDMAVLSSNFACDKKCLKNYAVEFIEQPQ